MKTIELEPSQLGKTVEDIYHGIEEQFVRLNFRDELTDMLEAIQSFHATWFAEETSPSGEKWPPLQPATVARKGHSRILIDTTRLSEALLSLTEDSIREVSDEQHDQGLRYGNRVEYSIFHQTGTEKLPTRSHVGLSESNVDDLSDTIASATVRKMAESERVV